MVKKSLLIWLLFIPAAILNGILRESILTPNLGIYALPLSGITLCLFIFIISWLLLPLLGKGKPSAFVRMGITWLLATILFETGMVMASGENWMKAVQAYNIFTGNLWAVVVIFTGITPWLVAKCRRLFSRRRVR